MRSSLQDNPMTLVSSWLTSARNSKANIPNGAREVGKIGNFQPIICRISEKGAILDRGYNDGRNEVARVFLIGDKIIDFG